MARIEYVDGEPNGLATIVGGLIEANLMAHPDRERLLRSAVVAFVATDIDVAVTFRLEPGKVLAFNGLIGRPQVEVRTDSDTLTELSSAPLMLGFPDARKPAGRAVVRKLLGRKLRVRGMLMFPDVVSRLNRLLSVV